MLVLGIDPAIRNTGYGVIEAGGASSFKILDCGVIRNTDRMSHSECLRRLAGGIRELADTFSPDVASIEDPFVGRNASTAIILGMARGAIIAVLAGREIPVYSYSPRHAKKVAVGSGGGSKEQVAAMMAAELGIDVSGIPLDATDALALAVCHAQIAMRPELLHLYDVKPL
ncbi:MAG: crossover junction endodeoxyribonuclease RuvC [Victivallaceae bacterium]|nr:crossover junction endodeoxyribonuclease RuvC [Victivallaceae bacterium]